MSLRFSLSMVFQVLVPRKVFLTTKYKFLIFESAKGGMSKTNAVLENESVS